MRVEKLDSGRYEAITNVNGYVVEWSEGVKVPLNIGAYGDTHFEAIKNCLNKVNLLLNPSLRKKIDGPNNNEF